MHSACSACTAADGYTCTWHAEATRDVRRGMAGRPQAGPLLLCLMLPLSLPCGQCRQRPGLQSRLCMWDRQIVIGGKLRMHDSRARDIRSGG